jgi:hypothetical protein
VQASAANKNDIYFSFVAAFVFGAVVLF